MKKKAVFLLTAMMLLSLTACGETTEETTVPTTAAAIAETTDAVEIEVSVPAQPWVKKDNPYRLKTYTMEHYREGELTYSNTFEYTFNEKGWVELITSTHDGMVNNTQVYEHDDYGNVIRSTSTESDGTQTIREMKLTLDEQHRVLFEEAYWDGELGATSEMAYDENGNMTMLNIVRMEDGEPGTTSWVDNTYDKNSNLIRSETLWDNGDGGYSLYEYQNGYLVCVERYDLKDVLTGYSVFSYDESGLVQTEFVYTVDGALNSKHIETRDEFGNPLTEDIFRYYDPITGETGNEELVTRYLHTYELNKKA